MIVMDFTMSSVLYKSLLVGLSAQALSVGVRQLRISLNGVELFRGELAQGCGNQIFDYCHRIPLVLQQPAAVDSATIEMSAGHQSSQGMHLPFLLSECSEC